MHRAAVVGVVAGVAAVAAAAAAATVLMSSRNERTTLATGSHPLTTGFLLDAGVTSAQQTAVSRQIASIGSRVERIHAIWGDIAPKKRSSSFDPTDPGDHAYDWTLLDSEIERARAAGLEPLVTVTGAPSWAQRQGVSKNPYGADDPDPKDYADFGTAIARRYSGRYHDLPRVRLWEAWNEPNVSFYFSPQTAADGSGGRVDVAAGLYRALLNAFVDAVHKVDSSNVVAGGSLAPFTIRGVSYVETTGGVRFLRELLCMSVTGPPKPVCHEKTKLDALSFHPYTSGGPLHKAYKQGDLSLGNMPEARAVLAAAVRAGNVVASRPVQFWVTEFSWDTKPPDKRAVPMKLHERWTAESLYRMWQNGVSLVTWYQVQDLPYPQNDYQSGLWFVDGRPKPSLLAYRFPFVAYRAGGKVVYWGRAVSQRATAVRLEADSGGSWRTIARVRADRYGIFRGSIPDMNGGGLVRAVAEGEKSVPFSLTPPSNENIVVTPFGVGSVK